VTRALSGSQGPVVAVTDFMTSVPDQVARWIPDDRAFVPLGTDGFGRSDTREALRRFFEIDAGHVAVAALSGLVQQGQAGPEEVGKAIAHYDIDPESPDPLVVC
jgi:pyruvate dehydrogenase E1 component